MHMLAPYYDMLRKGIEVERKIKDLRTKNEIPFLEKYILGFALLSISGDDTNFSRTLLNLRDSADFFSVSMGFRGAMICRLGIERDVFITNEIDSSVITLAGSLLNDHRSLPYMDIPHSIVRANSNIDMSDVIFGKIQRDAQLRDATSYYMEVNGTERIDPLTISPDIIAIVKKFGGLDN